MDKTAGLPRSPPSERNNEGATRYKGILPGSYQSGNFDHEEALEDIDRRSEEGRRLLVVASIPSKTIEGHYHAT